MTTEENDFLEKVKASNNIDEKKEVLTELLESTVCTSPSDEFRTELKKIPDVLDILNGMIVKDVE